MVEAERVVLPAAVTGPELVLRTFAHLPSIGSATERRLWALGIVDWDAFLQAPHIDGLGAERKATCDAMLGRLRDQVRGGDVGAVVRAFPRSLWWRIWRLLAPDAAYLDIETTGLHRGAEVTVVGVLFRGRYRSLVAGVDLDRAHLSDALERASLLVTFNGAQFDLPVLEQAFPRALPRLPHLDLRFLARAAGLRGGLKVVERSLGLARPKEVGQMSGAQAVYLWRTFLRTGTRRSLELLLRYNREDVVNLPIITALLERRAAAACGMPDGDGDGAPFRQMLL